MSSDERPTRLELHMVTALLWSSRSTCNRPTKVGAIITTADLTQVVSIGYNGPAKGLPRHRCTGVQGACMCLHAEENAILRARSVETNLAMISTHSPCIMCAQRIIQRGIRRVVYLDDYRDPEGRNLLRDAGCEVLKHVNSPIFMVVSSLLT